MFKNLFEHVIARESWQQQSPISPQSKKVYIVNRNRFIRAQISILVMPHADLSPRYNDEQAQTTWQFTSYVCTVHWQKIRNTYTSALKHKSSSQMSAQSVYNPSTKHNYEQVHWQTTNHVPFVHKQHTLWRVNRFAPPTPQRIEIHTQ